MKFYTFFTVFLFNLSLFAQENDPETGMASYYANGFNGRLTSYGERFNIYEFTAAHNKLPYNSIVKVTNLKNDKFVIVRINDRGPYTKKRILDLSPAAAKHLDMMKTGVAKVKLEVLKPSSPAEDSTLLDSIIKDPYYMYLYKVGKSYDAQGRPAKLKGYGIQVLTTSYPDSAAAIADSLASRSIQDIYTLVTVENKKIRYNICVGTCSKKTEATLLNDTLKRYGFNGSIKNYISSK